MDLLVTISVNYKFVVIAAVTPAFAISSLIIRVIYDNCGLSTNDSVVQSSVLS
jgi:hypothetical protein